MPLPAAALHYPHDRVLLSRTRLAYVHLRNLLTDAKRDRAARVYGYVEVWLPEELIILYLQEGEVVNATATLDGERFRALSIAEAVAMVPSAAEFGEICFCEAHDEQLATMYWSQVLPAIAWPAELDVHDPSAVLAFLHATMHDGVVEFHAHSGAVNYCVVRDGAVTRGFFVGPGVANAAERTRILLAGGRGSERTKILLWPVPPPLPVQAPPAMIQAYRDLVTAVVKRLVDGGADAAPSVTEKARLELVARHPCLDHFSLSHVHPRDPVTETPALTSAIGSWIGEVLWTVVPQDGATPARLIGEVARDRRHMFQSAGLFEALPWKVEW
ncbi:MAG TPA: hypothetical protein VGI97_10605 [Gemmatimonadaceae bacterium]|jgi:hypothetical protein